MFQFRLCLELGYTHPDYLLEDLTAIQLAEWEAFDKLDPIGSFREDLRMAQICSTNTNLVIQTNSKNKNPKLTEITDFMFDWDGTLKEQKNKKQSMEEMKALLLGIATTQNEKVKREKGLHNRKPMKRR